MPYDSINDLPGAVRVDLPQHAQQIYLKAYNAAHRDSGDSNFAEQAAWDAVTEIDEQDAAGHWHRKEATETEEIIKPDEA